jgi:hypothetical protein
MISSVKLLLRQLPYYIQNTIRSQAKSTSSFKWKKLEYGPAGMCTMREMSPSEPAACSYELHLPGKPF